MKQRRRVALAAIVVTVCFFSACAEPLPPIETVNKAIVAFNAQEYGWVDMRYTWNDETEMKGSLFFKRTEGGMDFCVTDAGGSLPSDIDVNDDGFVRVKKVGDALRYWDQETQTWVEKEQMPGSYLVDNQAVTLDKIYQEGMVNQIVPVYLDNLIQPLAESNFASITATKEDGVEIYTLEFTPEVADQNGGDSFGGYQRETKDSKLIYYLEDGKVIKLVRTGKIIFTDLENPEETEEMLVKEELKLIMPGEEEKIIIEEALKSITSVKNESRQYL